MEGLNIRPYDDTNPRRMLRMGDPAFGKTLYALRSYWSPGTVIIFNHYDFSKTPKGLPCRQGTHKDADSLQQLFIGLKFKVYRYDDLTKDEIITKIKDHVSNEWWWFSGSIVLIVTTHGEENGMLWASDEMYHCSQLWDPILQCDKLREKFKFIILQACRGSKKEKKFDLQKLKVVTENEDKVDSDNISTQMKNDRKSCATKISHEKALPDNAINLLIAHSTVEGCESLRDPEKGTWYVQELCEQIRVWAESKCNENILNSMTFINEQINIMKKKDDIEGQTSSFTSYLRDNIVYRKSSEFIYQGCFTLPNRRYKGRAYIYYDKNHKNEAKKFEDTMNQMLFLPIVVEIDHGETALQEIYNVSNKNQFYHEMTIIFAVFTKCETIISNNVPLREIYENFSAEKCPSLAGQCKMFFFLDAKHDTQLEVSMDYMTGNRSHYITNLSDFLIVRGHSKEFLESLNEQLLLTFENTHHHMLQILTVAMRSESKSRNGYTSNFESTLRRLMLFFPVYGAQLPKQLLEEKIEKPVFQNIELKQPVKSFTGREDDIKTLRCETSCKKQGRQLIRVSGPSGIGKTQLVSFFVTYFSWMFNNIIWINAENEQTILKSFQDTAVGLQLYNYTKINYVNIKEVFNSIRRYLHENTNLKTLFVFDNYTEIASKYIFDDIGSREIYYIITTNITNVIKDCFSINMQSFNETESIDFLSKLLLNSTKQETDMLAKELNNMPIFLQLAASFIIESQRSNPEYKISDFLSELSQKPGIILNKMEPTGYYQQYRKEYSTVCELKLTQIEKKNKLAQIILFIICFCNPDDIPLGIFQYYHNSRSKENIETKQEVNEKKVKIAISILTDENIINRNKNANTGNVHRLIQEYIQYSLQQKDKESKLLLIALNLIHYLLQTSLMSDEFALHAITIFKHALKYINEFDNHVQTAIMLATFLKDKSMENVARDFLTECHEVFELKFGVNSQECTSVKDFQVNNLCQ